MKTLIHLSLIVLMFIMTPLYAEKQEKEDNRYPLGCRDMDYKFDLKTLKLYPYQAEDHQSMFFFFNKFNQPINLYQMLDDDSSRSMYLNHTIKAGQWAVLATGDKEMKYICTVSDNSSRYGKIVDCGEVLKVCEFNNVVFGLNNRGNFWLVKNNSRGGALREVVHYGIIPAL